MSREHFEHADKRRDNRLVIALNKVGKGIIESFGRLFKVLRWMMMSKPLAFGQDGEDLRSEAPPETSDALGEFL